MSAIVADQRGNELADDLSGQESRQGKRGKPALIVLIVSVGLMLTSLMGLLLWQGESSPPDYASQSQASARKQVTGSESGNSNAVSSANSGAVSPGNPAYPQPAKRDAN